MYDAFRRKARDLMPVAEAGSRAGIPVDRATREGELQVAQLLVQVGAACAEEVTVAGCDAIHFGQAGFRSPQRIEAGQVIWAISERVEARQQAGQIHVRRRRLAAGHRVPERDLAIICQ